MVRTTRAAVMTHPGASLEFRDFPIPEVMPGTVLVRITCCTICGSDLHSWSGRRTAPTPIILGHEIVGEIIALGEGVSRDSGDQPVKIGDRITWTLTDSCGKCFYCSQVGLPMKCRSLRKYGHDSCAAPPHLAGGFAEMCILGPGTSIVKLPEGLTDEEACPANCALATVVAGWEAAGLVPLESVLIQGAGALGFYAAAYASLQGCRTVIVADPLDHRLERVQSFGATHTLNPSSLTAEGFVQAVRDLTEGFGVDAVMEVSGAPAAIAVGLDCLRIGGRYLELGSTYPNANVVLDMSRIVFRRLTLRGIHNYDARHLRAGVQFLAHAKGRFPFSTLVAERFPLACVNEAIRAAQSGGGVRVALLPSAS
jgi:putative phosphonate catabolism associated alcohol dehydrogenase